MHAIADLVIIFILFIKALIRGSKIYKEKKISNMP